jgi:hypothetical protein
MNTYNTANSRIGPGRTALAVVLNASLLIVTLGLTSPVAVAESATVREIPRITVYKSPACGCCKKWVNHLEANGFQVDTIEMQDLRMIKSMSGIAPKNASCHTAKVAGYVVEGHVPAADIKRMLTERPDIHGLVVPGMPMGSPGMEGPRKEAYEVLSIQQDGSTRVYARR